MQYKKAAPKAISAKGDKPTTMQVEQLVIKYVKFLVFKFMLFILSKLSILYKYIIALVTMSI